MVKNTENFSFEYNDHFCKEFNKITKKRQCPTLKEDFELFKRDLIEDFDKGKLPRKYHRIAGLDSCVNVPAFIVKDFRCRGIKRGKKSGFRIVFLLIESNIFYFTQIYYKGRTEVEDKERINKLFKNRRK